MNARQITILAVILWVGLGITFQGHKTGTKAVASDHNPQTISRHKMKDYPIQPIPFTDVNVTDDFWAYRIETNRKVTIPHTFKKCEETGRIDNFAIAGGLMQGKHRGDFPFDDTDPYKILEGAAYSLSTHPDPNLDKYLDDLITKIAAAQEDDGYLYTCRTNKCERLKNWYGDKRWSKEEGSHELYNMGHLYEAAVAHYQATGKRNLLDVATKNADFLDTVFGPGKNQSAPGHQIIEMGLARLYRATGNEKYLKLAKFYLDTRGPGGSEYNQSHKKPVDQTEAVGHAVRATYMYSGMADVAALTADQRYLQAIDKIWDNVVTKKLYITGGVGARGSGEAFGDDYGLPNASAYCETCAAIGNCFWNHRMFLSHGDAKYIDVLERTLYNALIAGVSLSGDSFFYPNPLESYGQYQRSPWFSCACCPGNIARFIPQVPGYVYAQQANRIYVSLFVDNSATIKMGENSVQLSQKTQYPWDGNVKITVEPKRPEKFAICVRIPGWAQDKPIPSNLYRYMDSCSEKVSLKVNSKPLALNIENGFAPIERNWKKGDVVELYLPMPVRRVIAHEKIKDDVGKVALQRGPIVYCAEWPDNNGHALNIVLPDSAELTTEYRKDMLNGVTVIRGKAVGLSFSEDGKTVLEKQQEFLAIPYYAWAHRGPGEMTVWLAKDQSAAQPLTPLGMIPNPSFEKAIDNNPVGWETRTYNGNGQFKYIEGGRTGNRCVMIASDSGGDLGWLTTIPVKPHSQYRLSGWIKTENLEAGSGKGALLNLHNIPPLQTSAVTGTKDWTQVELIFDTGENSVVTFNCLFGGWGLSTGKAWYDDLLLEPLPTKDVKPSVKIDATKTKEPISKYIYGQFIEHLGRCIYGGIWAEMLEDRKFYYPITDDFNPWGTATDRNWNTGPYKYLNASPWQVIGPAGTVSMDSTNPYVGAHTPVIQVPGDGTIAGTRQDGLAIVKGKDYTGRIILAGDNETLPITVRLVLDNGDEILSQEINKITSEFQTYPLTFTAPSSSDNVKIEITSKGKGKFKIGTLSLMPADNIKGWRPDVVALLKELDSPIYRWPGGNFVSGYNWRDGIGERDKRPPRKNPAWKGIEHNDVGIHEYIELMELIGAEPFVSVNTGLGTVEEVAEEVQYCNGESSTPMGKLRAQNGHPEPFNVKWWAVGNEMYGQWQLGHIPLEEYVKKHNRVAEAMWNVDRSIQLVGVGEVGKWSETMLKVCSEHMNLISEHIYCKEKTDVVEHTKQLSQQIIRKANAHRKYRKEIPELAGKDIRIAMDEWNFWYGDYIYGELGVRYHLKDALGVATGLHEYFRNSDLYFMANYAQTVNVIGCIKTSRTDAAFETTGLVLKLYRQHFGILPVEVTGDIGLLDVAAAWTNDRKALTVGVVNPTEQECELAMDLKGAQLTGTGQLWLITHSDPMAYNEPGKEPQVVIAEKPLTGISNRLSVPPLSISLYKLTTTK